MNSQIVRLSIDAPPELQEEVLKMEAEAERLRVVSDQQREFIRQHFDELFAKVPWWRRCLMRFGRWLKVKNER